MIRKSGYRFSEKIMLKQKIERDDDSKKSHPALALQLPFFKMGALSDRLVSSTPE
jgi:hypothetical protein